MTTSNEIKKALKQAFPTIKFSVTKAKGTSGYLKKWEINFDVNSVKEADNVEQVRNFIIELTNDSAFVFPQFTVMYWDEKRAMLEIEFNTTIVLNKTTQKYEIYENGVMIIGFYNLNDVRDFLIHDIKNYLANWCRKTETPTIKTVQQKIEDLKLEYKEILEELMMSDLTDKLLRAKSLKDEYFGEIEKLKEKTKTMTSR